MTDKEMIKELLQAGIDVPRPIITRPSDKTTDYYNYTRSHRHKLLIRDILNGDFDETENNNTIPDDKSNSSEYQKTKKRWFTRRDK